MVDVSIGFAPPAGRGLVVRERGELEERLLDELVDDARLHRAMALALLHRALNELRDVERAHRHAVA